MQKLSSPSTFFFKRVVPMTLVAVVAFASVQTVLQQADGWLGQLLVFGVLLAGYAFVFRKLIWDTADEVHVTGDELLVRRGRLQERVALRDVLNVSITAGTNPRRITLRLRKGSKFGDDLNFLPDSPITLNPFARNAVAEDLIHRVDRARGGA